MCTVVLRVGSNIVALNIQCNNMLFTMLTTRKSNVKQLADVLRAFVLRNEKILRKLVANKTLIIRNFLETSPPTTALCVAFSSGL